MSDDAADKAEESSPEGEQSSEKKPEKKKATIKVSYKIFSITLALIMLMGVVSIVSVWLIGNVRKEMDLVSIRYIGVERLITNVDTGIRVQQFHLERGLRFYKSGQKKRIADELGIFAEKGDHVFREFAFAERLLEKAAKLNPDQAENIKSLQGKINKVARRYAKLSSRQFKLLKKISKQKKAAGKLEKVIDKYMGEMEVKLTGLRQDIQSFVETATARVQGHEQRVLYINILLTVIAIIIGVITSIFVIRGITKPVNNLLRGTQAIEKGDLDGHIDVTTSDEIGQLTESFNEMVEELRLKEKIKGVFGKYVDPRIVNELIESEEGGFDRGEHREMSIFFSDIANFTNMSEKLDPDSLVRLINAYLTQMSLPIKDNLGVIDKFIGDAIMAFWGDPFTPGGRHPLLACNTALLQLEYLDMFKDEIPDLVDANMLSGDFDIRIGISTGEVLIGNIGSEDSQSYTVMGDTVNLASRLEGINKQYGTRIMISQRTHELAEASLECREIDTIRVKGKDEPVSIFELLALKGSFDDEKKQWRDTFEAALRAYRGHNFATARKGFDESLKMKPDDKAAQVFLERLDYFDKNPTAAKDWDGIWSFSSK